MRGFQMMEETGLAFKDTERTRVKVGRWEACGCSEQRELFGLAIE